MLQAYLMYALPLGLTPPPEAAYRFLPNTVTNTNILYLEPPELTFLLRHNLISNIRKCGTTI